MKTLKSLLCCILISILLHKRDLLEDSHSSGFHGYGISGESYSRRSMARYTCYKEDNYDLKVSTGDSICRDSLELWQHAVGNGDTKTAGYHQDYANITYNRNSVVCSGIKKQSSGLNIILSFAMNLTMTLIVPVTVHSAMLHSLVSGIVACYSQMYIAHAIGRTVDIASPELISACKSAPTDCKEIQQHLCIMSHSFSITRVLNSGNLIWESQSHGEACIYYTVYQFYGQNYLGYLKIRNGLFSHYVHYRINGEEWREIAFEEYVLTFSRMRTERIFDVGFPEDHIVRTTEYTPFGTPAFIYNPYETYKIVKVQDGIVNIWESNSACVNCEYVVVHKARGEPRMVHMFVKDGDTYDILYFDRIGTKWIGIQKADFYAKLGELDGEITRL